MLGDKLRIARQQKGWTQSEVSKETYIPQTTISKIENNIYVHLSDKEVRENAVVVCPQCGLEYYVVNLVPKVCWYIILIN